MKKQPKKLALAKETVLALDDDAAPRTGFRGLATAGSVLDLRPGLF